MPDGRIWDMRLISQLETIAYTFALCAVALLILALFMKIVALILRRAALFLSRFR